MQLDSDPEPPSVKGDLEKKASDNLKPELETITGSAAESSASSWISGWRLIAIATGQASALFMVQMESSVTSTAITSITDNLGGFEKSPWVFTAYLLTYSAFPILLSKISDILGRKQVLLGCLVMFVIFSGACGASQTLIQLIMFRWIKGVGAGGIVAICIGYGFELRPPEKWAAHSAFLTLSAAAALAISPLVGAAFTQAGQWRWCFLVNVPIGVAAGGLLLTAMPNKLRLEPAAKFTGPNRPRERLSRLRRLDFPGAVMLTAASVLLLTALQQAAGGAPFHSPEVLTLLVLAPVFLAGFVAWQRCIVAYSWNLDPILSWNLVTNRVFMAANASAWLSGMVMTVSIVQIPQRFMLVNRLSAIDAGVRLLPFTAVMTCTSVVVSAMVTKLRIPVIYLLLFSACIQVAGVAGLSRASTEVGIQPTQYGFQILAAVGVGFVNIILLLLTPYVVDKKDLAVGNGAINQFRILGGSLGLSIVTCTTVPTLRANLLEVLSPEQTAMVLDRTDRILSLSPETQVLVRRMFGQMYNTQMTILIGIAAAQALATAFQWQMKPIILKK